MGQLEKSLIDSLHTGFIDKDKMSLEKYRPKLLINNHKEGREVLSNIINELGYCDEFFFSVAFITYSGVLVLLNTLKELEAKGKEERLRPYSSQLRGLVSSYDTCSFHCSSKVFRGFSKKLWAV